MRRVCRTDIEAYEHFNSRYQERFNGNLTFKEYIGLYNKPFRFIYRVSNHKTYGEIEINGKPIKVIKHKRAKQIQTCFTDDMDLPIPMRGAKRGFVREDFNRQLDNTLSIIKELSHTHKDVMINDPKKYFTEVCNLYPKWMYHAAYAYNKSNSLEKCVSQAVSKMY